MEKKLTKNQIFTTDISESVDSVLNPAAPLALRVSGHLMLGIVRIYSRKVKYLMADATEAMWYVNVFPSLISLFDLGCLKFFSYVSDTILSIISR